LLVHTASKNHISLMGTFIN